MNDEELKTIIEETSKNNNSTLNEEVFNIVKKIIALPNNYETSISTLASDEIKYNNELMFKVYNVVTEVCNKLNITLDTSKYEGQIVGLPFNLLFTKK